MASGSLVGVWSGLGLRTTGYSIACGPRKNCHLAGLPANNEATRWSSPNIKKPVLFCLICIFRCLATELHPNNLSFLRSRAFPRSAPVRHSPAFPASLRTGPILKNGPKMAALSGDCGNVKPPRAGNGSALTRARSQRIQHQETLELRLSSRIAFQRCYHWSRSPGGRS